MKTLVHFGAGNIGRSLVGRLFSRAGWEVVFVDAVARIVDALNERRRYVVRIRDELPPGAPDAVEVDHVRGILATDTDGIAEAIAHADLIGTSVGAAALPKVLAGVALGLPRRTSPVSILICENLRDAARTARRELARHLPPDFDLAGRVGLVETSIGKMVPLMPADVRERDPLEVWGEAYNRIVADRDGFAGDPPQVEGLVLKGNFAAYVDRKLFIHNLGHAAAAYHGFLSGKTCIWECMDDGRIRGEAEGAMWESGRALIRRYPAEFTEANQREHIEDLLRRFGNRALGDTVFRVGRGLHRKLAPNDRLIGALRLVVEEGGEPGHIARATASAFRFRAGDAEGRMLPEDEEFHRELEAAGIEVALRAVCGLDGEKDRVLVELIREEYARLRTAHASAGS